jgi:hypothetical protein
VQFCFLISAKDKLTKSKPQVELIRFLRTFMKTLALVLLIATLSAFSSLAQTEPKHFAKDGLSFDYPATWQISDLSTGQMQMIQLMRDGYAEIRLRVPREVLKTPEKEAAAKKLFQDRYVEQFVESLQQAGLKPNRSEVSSDIAGGPAPGTSVRAILDREPGGMDSYYRVVSDRFVNLSEIGSEADMKKSADAWNLLRGSLKIEAPAQPAASPAKKP